MLKLFFKLLCRRLAPNQTRFVLAVLGRHFVIASVVVMGCSTTDRYPASGGGRPSKEQLEKEKRALNFFHGRKLEFNIEKTNKHAHAFCAETLKIERGSMDLTLKLVFSIDPNYSSSNKAHWHEKLITLSLDHYQYQFVGPDRGRSHFYLDGELTTSLAPHDVADEGSVERKFPYVLMYRQEISEGDVNFGLFRTTEKIYDKFYVDLHIVEEVVCKYEL